MHTADLPLYDNAAKVGFGLWRHVAFSFPLELIVLGLGAWLYARATAFASTQGQYVFWGFVIFLAALQVYANFGPSPATPDAMAVTALAFYVVLALLAQGSSIATVPTETKLAQLNSTGARDSHTRPCAAGSSRTCRRCLGTADQDWAERRRSHVDAAPQ